MSKSSADGARRGILSAHDGICHCDSCGSRLVEGCSITKTLGYSSVDLVACSARCEHSIVKRTFQSRILREEDEKQLAAQYPRIAKDAGVDPYEPVEDKFQEFYEAVAGSRRGKRREITEAATKLAADVIARFDHPPYARLDSAATQYQIKANALTIESKLFEAVRNSGVTASYGDAYRRFRDSWQAAASKAKQSATFYATAKKPSSKFDALPWESDKRNTKLGVLIGEMLGASIGKNGELNVLEIDAFLTLALSMVLAGRGNAALPYFEQLLPTDMSAARLSIAQKAP